MKIYVIFAGVNGAGKSTLYQSSEEYLGLPRVNLDEIVKEIGSWKVEKDAVKAGMIAVKMIKDYFEKGISFNQETTLCGHSIIRNIHKAKEYGYYVDMNYVGLDSSELAIQRVKKRVLDGGHGIPDEDVIKRYSESIKNLKTVISICDKVTVYDNTKSFRRIALFIEGKCIDKADEIPMWFKEFIEK